MAEVLQAKIDRKSAMSLQCGQLDPKKGPPPIIFARKISINTNRKCLLHTSSEPKMIIVRCP